MPSIFVSHSHLDNAFGLRLIGDLKARFGADAVWYDASGGLHNGDEWLPTIIKEIERREVFVVILSPNAIASKWVPREMDIAYYLHVNEGKHLVPVMLAPCTPPANWRIIQGPDFANDAQYTTRLQLLSDDLARLAPAPRAAAPAQNGSPPSIIVDQMHRGDFLTITDAVAAARPGTQIRIHPGLYQEGIVLDKPLELVGEGNRDDIVIAAKDKYVIDFQTTAGRVANLTLRQTGGDYYAVGCLQGRLALEDCDIASQGRSCIGVCTNADPRIRRNHIHDGRTNGIVVYDHGEGLIEDNEIDSNSEAGIAITTGGNPTVRRNHIFHSQYNGIVVYEQGRGLIEDNEIDAHIHACVVIATNSNPTVRRNRIHNGKTVGIFIHSQGRGTIEDNEITNHIYSGIEIRTESIPIVQRNTIAQNKHAILIADKGGGTFEDNDLRGNWAAWDISTDSASRVKRARNRE